MELTELINCLIDAKGREEQAKQYRISVEEQIASLIPGPDKGSKTVTVDGFKVTVERGFNYRADCNEIDKAHCWVSLGYPAPIKQKTTRELDEKGYEWYRENHADLFASISRFVTVAPKKIAVSIKEVKQ